MKLFDEVISKINALCAEKEIKVLPVDESPKWEDAGKNNMVLRFDMAYELGGGDGKLPAVGGTAVTDEESLVSGDEIVLIGPDLKDIHSDIPYARIALVRVDSEAMGEGNQLFDSIKKIEFVRYHVAPSGFMMRVSSTRKRESVRVSKEAINKGISFKDVGSLMIREFHKNKRVEAVKVIFITDPTFNFEALEKNVKDADEITKAIDHILKNVMTDCNACSMQTLCNEIEGMKEMHMAQMAQD